MKLLQKLVRTIEQKSKRQLIFELLTVQTSTPDAVELFENVKADFLLAMEKRGKQASYDSRLIIQLQSPIIDKSVNKIKIY